MNDNHTKVLSIFREEKWVGYAPTIAGGYVRDMILDIEPSDIDVYLFSPTDEVDTLVLEIREDIKNTGLTGYTLRNGSHEIETPVPELEEEEEEYEDISVIRYVLNVDFHDGSIPIQIILLSRHPTLFVQSGYDTGICMAWMGIGRDNSKGILTAKKFDRDVANKTITIYPMNLDPWQAQGCLLKHIPKLQRKFPDYRVEVHDVHIPLPR